MYEQHGHYDTIEDEKEDEAKWNKTATIAVIITSIIVFLGILLTPTTEYIDPNTPDVCSGSRNTVTC